MEALALQQTQNPLLYILIIYQRSPSVHIYPYFLTGKVVFVVGSACGAATGGERRLWRVNV